MKKCDFKSIFFLGRGFVILSLGVQGIERGLVFLEEFVTRVEEFLLSQQKGKFLAFFVFGCFYFCKGGWMVGFLIEESSIRQKVKLLVGIRSFGDVFFSFVFNYLKDVIEVDVFFGFFFFCLYIGQDEVGSYFGWR